MKLLIENIDSKKIDLFFNTFEKLLDNEQSKQALKILGEN